MPSPKESATARSGPPGDAAPRLPGSDDPRIQPADRAEWRAWLEANHAIATGVWVVGYRRPAGRSSLDYEAQVEEALCFGWIDSRSQGLDDGRWMLRYTPRKRGSVWARSNKERVERLEAEGRMAEAGRRMVEAAKADGSWDAFNDVEAMIVPDDLAAALAASPEAARGFQAMSPSTRRMILFWVTSAKRPETRARRIGEAQRSLAAGRNPVERPAPSR